MFALSGAAAAVKIKLDLFGVLVLAYCASSAGGILRDLLIGAVPPAAVTDWRFLAATLLAGFCTMLYPAVFRLRSAVPMLDALGLGLFAVDGARKALEYGLGPVAASMLGMLTGIGGGMVRDLLVSEVPVVLRSEIYAVAALAGSSVYVVGHVLALPPGPTAFAGATFSLALRMLSIRRGGGFRWRGACSRRNDARAAETSGRQNRGEKSPLKSSARRRWKPRLDQLSRVIGRQRARSSWNEASILAAKLAS
jgi:uncharacterized membrane protein YeiH